MQHATPVLRGPFVRLRLAQFDALAQRQGLATDTAKAEFIGIDKGTLSRVVNGEGLPGERFIAACIATFGAAFEDLFEVVQ